MQDDEINRVIQAFGAVIEETASHTYGSPERLLPYPRETIRAAARQVYLTTSDPAHLNMMETCLLYLGHFLPEPEGSIAGALAGTHIELGDAIKGLASAGPEERQRFDEAATRFTHASRLLQLLQQRDAETAREIAELRAARSRTP